LDRKSIDKLQIKMFRVIVTVGLLLFALAAKKLVTWRNHICMARSSGFVVRKSP
jgi:hypothetical protein